MHRAWHTRNGGNDHKLRPARYSEWLGFSSGNFLSHACSDGNFIAGVVREAAKEIERSSPTMR